MLELIAQLFFGAKGNSHVDKEGASGPFILVIGNLIVGRCFKNGLAIYQNKTRYVCSANMAANRTKHSLFNVGAFSNLRLGTVGLPFVDGVSNQTILTPI